MFVKIQMSLFVWFGSGLVFLFVIKFKIQLKLNYSFIIRNRNNNKKMNCLIDVFFSFIYFEHAII